MAEQKLISIHNFGDPRVTKKDNIMAKGNLEESKKCLDTTNG